MKNNKVSPRDRQSSIQQEIFIRFIPKTVIFRDGGSYQSYVLEIEKARQVIGKTKKFASIGDNLCTYSFSGQKNKFDHAVVNDKKLLFTWGLYRIEGDGRQQRIYSEDFDMSSYYNKFLSNQNNAQYAMKIDLIEVELQFSVLMQDYSANLLKLTSVVLDQKDIQVIKIKRSEKNKHIIQNLEATRRNNSSKQETKGNERQGEKKQLRKNENSSKSHLNLLSKFENEKQKKMFVDGIGPKKNAVKKSQSADEQNLMISDAEMRQNQRKNNHKKWILMVIFLLFLLGVISIGINTQKKLDKKYFKKKNRDKN